MKQHKARRGARPLDSAPLYEVEITGLGAAGEGVSRLCDGRVMFVASALPGDRVRCAVTRAKKGVLFGRVVELLVPSPDRVQSRCQNPGCGGCGLAELSLEAQARLKRERVQETLRRLGRIDVSAMLGAVKQTGDGWAYRHRVRLHAAWDFAAQSWALGYHGRQSHDVVALGDCPILQPPLLAAAQALAAALAGLPRVARMVDVRLAYSRRDERVAAVVSALGEPEVWQRALPGLLAAGLAGVRVELEGHTLTQGDLALRYDHALADEFELGFEPGVFTQACPRGNDGLVASVVCQLAGADGGRVLELCAGIGNFTVPLARAGVPVVAVEADLRASDYCRRNLEGAGFSGALANGTIAVHAETDAAVLAPGHAVRQALGRDAFAAVLLDPPRTGAAAAVTALALVGPMRVVYVSCDPATLARDLATLVAGGYRVVHLEAHDLFAQTPHVEVVAVCERVIDAAG